MNYSDQQLEQALAKMLPDKICIKQGPAVGGFDYFYFNTQVEYNGPEQDEVLEQIKDTELLHLCWLVEEELTPNDLAWYEQLIHNIGFTKSYHATWQQRTIALCKVKRVEII